MLMTGGTKPAYIQWLGVIVMVGLDVARRIALRASLRIFKMPEHLVPRANLFLVLAPILAPPFSKPNWVGLSIPAMHLSFFG